MTDRQYTNHLINLAHYTHCYYLESACTWENVRWTACAEAASHALGICWVLVDYHSEGDFLDPTAALGWTHLAHRWESTVKKCAERLHKNKRDAYLAPLRERKALDQWPPTTNAKVSETVPVPPSPSLELPFSAATSAKPIAKKSRKATTATVVAPPPA